MPKGNSKNARKHPSSKKLAEARHVASVKKFSSEKDLHHMIRLIGALFPLRQDKNTKRSLELLSELSKKKGFKSLYGLLKGLLAEEISPGKLEKASETVVTIFKEESGIDLIAKLPENKKRRQNAGGLLRGL